MRRQILGLSALVLLFLVLSPGTVMAQQEPEYNASDIRAYIKKHWPQFFANKRLQKNMMPTGTPMDKKAKMGQILQNMSTGYEKQLLHYDTLLSKIESRRDKLAEEGKDTSKIDEAIRKIEERKEQLKEQFAEKKQKLMSVSPSDTPATLKEKLGPELSALRESFKELHGDVDDLVRELKAAAGFTVTPRPTKLLLPTGIRQFKKMINVPPPRYKQGAN